MDPKEPALPRPADGDGPVDVTAVLVNYRSALETVAAVETLLETAGDLSVQVLVVENQSGGEEVDLLRKRLPPGVELLESPRNLGFAGGIELAVPKARGRFLLLLNPD
ncbi:MAG TPA: glycosyltransferase, partial [Planctomycetes bacterium]|nr:glycosyltransferase [Planctomycetota bacterium]